MASIDDSNNLPIPCPKLYRSIPDGLTKQTLQANYDKHHDSRRKTFGWDRTSDHTLVRTAHTATDCSGPQMFAAGVLERRGDQE